MGQHPMLPLNTLSNPVRRYDVRFSHSYILERRRSFSVELIRRALVGGYKAIAVTDHVGLGNIEFVVKTLVTDCEMATKRWDILALPGVEITHVPKDDIDLVARTAKEMGAKLVVVHGETVVEPVEPGTNEAAIRSSWVDVLAHPGLITPDEARLGHPREDNCPRLTYRQRIKLGCPFDRQAEGTTTSG